MEEPWGYEFEVMKHAEICTYLVNGLYRPKTLVKPSDFYPKKNEEPVEQEKSSDQIEAMLRSRFGGQKECSKDSNPR